MSAEQRVTDEAMDCTHFVITKKQWLDLNALAQSQAATIAEMGTAHRATEAKLRDALAEVERLARAYDHAVSKWQETAKILAEVTSDFRLARTMQEETRVKWLDEAQRATTAESALAETEAKLAATLAEVERLKRELADTNHEFKVTVDAYEEQECEIATAESALAATKARLEAAEEAIRWALGEVGDFATRGPGDGAFWWRVELRKRAALTSKESPDATR